MAVAPPTARRASQHARRRAHRAVEATLRGRKPGRPGVSRKVPGSHGGSNGARSARRSGRAWVSKKRKRSQITQGTCTGDAPQLARERCVVVEVFAGLSSKVAEEAARVGCAAVRIVKGGDGPTSDAPKLVPGQVVTWHLNLLNPTHAARLYKLLADLGRRTCSRVVNRLSRVMLLTAPPCTAWCSWNKMNVASGKVSLAAWRRGRRNGWTGLRVARRSHAVLMAASDPQRVTHIHEQPARALAPTSESFARHVPEEWPWGISHPTTVSTTCHGCALGLRVKEKVLQKGWCFQTLGTDIVPRILAEYTCNRDHAHSAVCGRLSKRTEDYPRELAAFLTADFFPGPLP